MDSTYYVIFIISGIVTLCFCLECPKCKFARNTNACLEETETCSPFQDICVGTLQEWTFTMGCGTSKRCEYDELQSTTDCRGNEAFKVNDRCTVCCKGAYCNERLNHVQKGLDLVSSVLHCPVCSDVDDPEICMENIQPCTPESVTCEVSKKGPLYISTCATNRTCIHDHRIHPGSPSCLHDPNLCSVCCNDFSCLNHILGVPPTEALITPGIEVSPGTMGPEIHPTIQQPTCHDDTLFPCHTTGGVCADNDIATLFCPQTCGLCPETSVAPPVQSTSAYNHACPSCRFANNVHDCLARKETCHHPDDVCLIEMSRWKITSQCATPTMCSDFQARLSTVDCKGGMPFSPRDKCYACCTGNECNNTMHQVQKGLDSISSVLHCPDCRDEMNPQNCLDNFVPCAPHHQTCEVSRRDGLFSSRCTEHTKCERQQDHHPGAIDCFHQSSDCAVCCHDHDCINIMFGVSTPPPGQLATTPQPGQINCKDKELFPCHKTLEDGACVDPDFAHEFCPETCGLCPTTAGPTTPNSQVSIGQCKDSQLYPCLFTTASTCADPDLAAAFCPALCGLCNPNIPQGGHTTPVSTTTPAPTTTPLPPHLVHPTLECPSCHHLGYCLRNHTQQCHVDHDICMGTVLEWGFHMECSYSHFCAHKQHLTGTTDCLRNGPYGPHEECYICCTGDDCNNDLQIVQQNFLSIPNTLHCPSCHHVSNPEECLQNIVACPPLTTTCLIRKSDGLYSSECNRHRPESCNDEYTEPLATCLENGNNSCHACCDHTDCLKQALHHPTSAPATTEAQTVQVNCKDDNNFPCRSAASTICSDPDFSLKTCPVTCGHCGGGHITTTATTMAPLTVQADCKDDPSFPCTMSVCSDPDFGILTCPVTCGHCVTESPTPAPTTVECKDDPSFPCTSAGSTICDDPDFGFRTCPLTCGHC